MIKSKKSLGVQSVVEVELDQESSKSYINKDGIVSHNCKWCRKFYGDAGQVPKLYKLTSILQNGSNYGKKTSDWLPVTGSTHPNTRTSPILELKPGFKILPGGRVAFMGSEKWDEWLSEHLEY